MSTILDLPTVKNRTHLLSLKEYSLGELGFLSKQTELIEGVILQKIPKSPKHATMVKKIFQFFMKTLTEGFHTISEQPITLSRSEPEPDISVVSGSIEDYSESHPTTAELVIEVSLSTLSEDREMANIYAEELIPEYWLFNLNNSTVEVYIKPQNGRYSEMKTYSKNKMISPRFNDSIRISLESLF